MYRVLCTLMFLPYLTAGPVTAWSAVEALATGEHVRVTLWTGISHDGTVDHVTPTALYIAKNGTTISALREDVRRIRRPKRGSGLKWALIGAGIGASAGGVAGPSFMEKEPGRAAAIGGTVGLATLVGAGVGYWIGHGRSVLVYEAAERPTRQLESTPE